MEIDGGNNFFGLHGYCHLKGDNTLTSSHLFFRTNRGWLGPASLIRQSPRENVSGYALSGYDSQLAQTCPRGDYHLSPSIVFYSIIYFH